MDQNTFIDIARRYYDEVLYERIAHGLISDVAYLVQDLDEETKKQFKFLNNESIVVNYLRLAALIEHLNDENFTKVFKRMMHTPGWLVEFPFSLPYVKMVLKDKLTGKQS